MARKHRKKPKIDPNLTRRQTWDWFFKPLMDFKPSGEMLREWLEFLFHTKYRTIDSYMVINQFNLPGKHWVTPTQHSNTSGRRNMITDSILTVRKDFRDNHIDVEISHPEQVFRLTFEDWAAIIPHLSKINIHG